MAVIWHVMNSRKRTQFVTNTQNEPNTSLGRSGTQRVEVMSKRWKSLTEKLFAGTQRGERGVTQEPRLFGEKEKIAKLPVRLAACDAAMDTSGGLARS